MRTLVLLSMVVSCLLVTSGPAGGERGLRHDLSGEGLSVNYPSGWSRIGHPLTNCSDPVEVIDIGGPPTRQPGWLVPFQDAGRGFYAYLYPGSLNRRDDVLAILNSLEVGRR